MDKYLIIKELLEVNNPELESVLARYCANSKKYNNKTSDGVLCTLEDFITLLSKEKYNLRELGFSSTTYSKLLKELFPDRITGSTGNKPCTFILRKYGYKWCSCCAEVLYEEDFRPNKAVSGGLNSECRNCHSSNTAKTQAFRQKKYECAKLNRTPSWADLEKIKEVYASCPKGYHVDHIIPLQGELVSGLHVHSNLRIIPAQENCIKHNKYVIE